MDGRNIDLDAGRAGCAPGKRTLTVHAVVQRIRTPRPPHTPSLWRPLGCIAVQMYFDVLTTGIVESKGTIDKYIGDGLMAFWNSPEPVENHQQRAVECAIRCPPVYVFPVPQCPVTVLPRPLLSGWLILYWGGGSEAGWVGLSGFPPILGKMHIPPRGGCPLCWVGGWVAELGRPPMLFMGQGTL